MSADDDDASLICVVTRAPFGRCVVAMRAIEPGTILHQERPVLVVDPEDAAGTPRTERCLKAFCRASADAQARALTFFSGDGEVELTSSQRTDLEQARACAQKPWARKHSVEVLCRVALAFNLNAHSFGGTTALFELGAIFAHACDANARFVAIDGYGCHVAVRPIEAGEFVNANYLGSMCIMSHPMRQRALFERKLFHCTCERCCGPDRARGVPCPRCHPRREDGSLAPQHHSNPEGSIAIPSPVPLSSTSDGKGSEATQPPAKQPPPPPSPTELGECTLCWRCASCSFSYTAAQVEAPLKERCHSSSPPLVCPPHLTALGATWQVEAAIEREMALSSETWNYAQQTTLQLSRPCYDDLVARHASVARVLGASHWTTTRLAASLSQLLAMAMKASTKLKTLGVSRAEALGRMNEYHTLCWRFCVEMDGAVALPVFADAFSGESYATLLAEADESRVSTSVPRAELLLHALACVSARPWQRDPATRQLRQTLAEHMNLAEARGTEAAAVLKRRGNEAYQHGDARESLVYYRAALMCAPTEAALHSNVAAALKRIGQYAPAAAAARHCIRISPSWVKGYLHLSSALLASADLDGAAYAAERAAEVGPEDPAVAKMQDEILSACSRAPLMQMPLGGGRPARAVELSRPPAAPARKHPRVASSARYVHRPDLTDLVMRDRQERASTMLSQCSNVGGVAL